MKKFILLSICTSLLCADYYYSEGKRVDIEPLNQQRTLESGDSIDYYRLNGKRVGVSSTLIVSFKDGVDREEVYLTYNLKELDRLMPNTFLVEVSNKSSISTSAKLYESGLVNYAHPNFFQNRERRATDTYFNLQWHLIDTEKVVGANINITEAWKITKGAGVKVAIFDDAVDTTHEDLKDGVVASYSAIDESIDATPKVSDNAHGTFIAGVIGARENGKGIVGVAPESSIVGMKGAVGEGVEDSTIIKAFQWAKNSNVDVMNNSWGGYNVSEGVKSAIVDCATNGRDGKGMIITFGHGNDGCNDKEQCKKDGEGEALGYIQNDESAIEEVLAIGATNHLNKRASYSNYGQYLDFVAPGGDGDEVDIDDKVGIVSIDISGEMGWSKTQYENGYGEVIEGDSDLNYITKDPSQVGTSYAAPIVAGVSALMISANPDLTREQIVKILKETSDKIGDYSYIDGKSYELGYGRVNATKALQRALELKTTSVVDTTNSEVNSSEDSIDSIYNFNSMTSGWHLLGAVENLENLKEKYNLKVIWSYDLDTWSKNPTSIEKAKGFWIYK